MKKNFLKHGFAAAFALVAGYGVYASQQKVEMSDLAIANVEALAMERAVQIQPGHVKGVLINVMPNAGCVGLK